MVKPARRARRARRILAGVVVGLVAAGVATVGIIQVRHAGVEGNDTRVETQLVKSFTHDNMRISVTGGGRTGTLTLNFDTNGNYATQVTGTPGGRGDGQLIVAAGAEYTRALQPALYATMYQGVARLPKARAQLYAKEYSGVWLNMVGAPQVDPLVPRYTTGRGLLLDLGGTGHVATTSGTWDGRSATVLTTATSTWYLREGEAVGMTLKNKHGLATFHFAYGVVGSIMTPVKSQVPPLPVNTSLEPLNYPLVLDPFGALYTVTQELIS